MARALECPACGAQHRIQSLPDSPTFRCDRCGQILKVPTPVSSTAGGPAPPARAVAVAPVVSPDPAAPVVPADSGAPVVPEVAEAPVVPVAPPPRTRAPGNDAPVPNVTGVSATVAAVADDDASGRRGRRSKTTSARATRSKVSWYWRLLAWIVAVPVGFVITAWPAYELGLIKKDDVLDIFVGTGTGRYVRLAIGTAIWALVTALLVQLFVEGGRAWMARRRRSRAVTA